MDMIDGMRYGLRIVAGCLLLGLAALASSAPAVAFGGPGCTIVPTEGVFCTSDGEVWTNERWCEDEEGEPVGESEVCATCITDPGSNCEFDGDPGPPQLSQLNID